MNNNMILNDSDLEDISGGAKKIVRTKMACPHCSKIIEVNLNSTSAKCPFCKKIITLAG